jgi:hypothetical protein
MDNKIKLLLSGISFIFYWACATPSSHKPSSLSDSSSSPLGRLPKLFHAKDSNKRSFVLTLDSFHNFNFSGSESRVYYGSEWVSKDIFPITYDSLNSSLYYKFAYASDCTETVIFKYIQEKNAPLLLVSRNYEFAYYDNYNSRGSFPLRVIKDYEFGDTLIEYNR